MRVLVCTIRVLIAGILQIPNRTKENVKNGRNSAKYTKKICYIYEIF